MTCKFCHNKDCVRLAQRFKNGPYYLCCGSCGATVTWGLNDKQKTYAMYGIEKRKDN